MSFNRIESNKEEMNMFVERMDMEMGMGMTRFLEAGQTFFCFSNEKNRIRGMVLSFA